MDKITLKTKWGKYCDTDKLADDACDLYASYNHPCSIHGMCSMLNEYFTQKEPLIRLFATSNHYIGNMRIAVQKEFERQINANEIMTFFNQVEDALFLKELLRFEDNSGKTMTDYLLTGKKIIDVGHLPSEKEQSDKAKLLKEFDYNSMATIKTHKVFEEVRAYINAFSHVCNTKLPSDMVHGNPTAPALKKGTKTSRAFNTVCNHYGIDKLHPTVVESTDENGNVTTRTTYPYNKVFAKYADLVSDLARKMYFVISLNPLDYLTMSNGVSWESCHNIRNGGYKGGTLSYMLDNTSMITFVVSEMDDPLHKVPKYYRQMFHYENGLFVQNRLYPQANDGAVDLYNKFREFVVEEFTELLNVDGEWEAEVGSRNCTNHIRTVGRHYPDYNHNNRCNIFYPVSKRSQVRNHIMQIGHNAICAKCGREHRYSNMLSHDRRDADCIVELEV